MKRAAIIALFLFAASATAREEVKPPPQLPPCMPVSEMHMTHVVRVPTWPNFLSLRNDIRLKHHARTVIVKISARAAEKPAAETVKGPILRSAKRVGGCKPGRTKNSKGQCGRWK